MGLTVLGVGVGIVLMWGGLAGQLCGEDPRAHLSAGRAARGQAHWSREGQRSRRGSATGGGDHPVEDKGAGAEDARVALPRNQGSCSRKEGD